MKRLTFKLKTVLLNNKGESLMESVASLLIFSILMMAVATMITASLRITSASTKDASERQDAVNKGIMEDYDTTPTNDTLTFEGTGINVTIPVEISDEDGYVAFIPEGTR